MEVSDGDRETQLSRFNEAIDQALQESVTRFSRMFKTMEGVLFEEQERAQVTLNSIGDAVSCVDIAGNITFINIVAEKLTG